MGVIYAIYARVQTTLDSGFRRNDEGTGMTKARE
jgi:hypothetical protein